MSEEILKAITQLFAIITKQDEGVTDKEREFITSFFKQRLSSAGVQEYLSLYESHLEEKAAKEGRSERQGLTSMKDSVRTLAICKKINKTLTQKQKAIVLVELLELVTFDNNFTEKRKEIINTVSEVFNISNDEYEEIEAFITNKTFEKETENLMIISNKQDKEETICLPRLDGHIDFIRIPSVDLIFVKIFTEDDIKINNLSVSPSRVYLFSPGSILNLAKGGTIYFSDIISHFNKDKSGSPLSFNCKNLEFQFPNGKIGLRNIEISETKGKLIGIMGASGAGKTTLLNVLAGIETPSSGAVLINNIDIHREKDKVQGIIGYIPQDDILIENLSVYDNLLFNAKLCFNDKNPAELEEVVDETLKSLGLYEIRHIQVGNVLNKKISGGQRKRLNIALELIREPSVLFVDEPTSGLSSRDSENVIDLLKELALKGKLIFVVIHQPSSDIYRKFDKMYIMDTGGYPIFYGNPIDAVIHFKTESNQINAEKGACDSCGSVNPELMFDIIEAKIVNEYGKITEKRKIAPTEWEKTYREKCPVNYIEDIQTPPQNVLKIPTKLFQWFIFTSRDLKSKVSNKQYLLINLLEAPLLAFVLSFIIRYTNSPDGTSYMYRYNENIPAYLLMSIVVALFMGLTVSAEEIIRDRKILKREQFLNLSKNSYLLSKIGLLFTLSAIQTILFVFIGNLILGIHGMYFNYWIVLFSISCFANVLGLNISSSFDEVVNVYIVIPLLLIPQMVLSGALFPFDKLNDILRAEERAPHIADVMASRWAYEALSVDQAMNNEYSVQTYEYDRLISNINFNQAYKIPEIETLLNKCKDEHANGKTIGNEWNTILSSMREFENSYKNLKIDPAIYDAPYSVESHKKITIVISEINNRLTKTYNYLNEKKEKVVFALNKYYKANNSSYEIVQDENFNESLDEIVKNINTKNRLVVKDNRIIQKIDPIYFSKDVFFTHLYAPEKTVFGNKIATPLINIVVIWLMTLLLYFTLYFDFFRNLLFNSSRVFTIFKTK